MVKDMLEQGVVEPSRSPWASPIEKRTDGSTSVWTIGNWDDTLNLLAGVAYFSTLDLAAGYWLVQMDSVPREDSLFRYLRITENAFRIGQCSSYVSTINGDHVGRSGPRWMSHLSWLCDCLWEDTRRTQPESGWGFQSNQESRRAGLRLKPKKCHFAG